MLLKLSGYFEGTKQYISAAVLVLLIGVDILDN